MKTAEKCQKLSAVLETFAQKLRDPNIGVDLWDENEDTFLVLTSKLHKILTKASMLRDHTAIENPEDIEEWPDIIYFDEFQC